MIESFAKFLLIFDRTLGRECIFWKDYRGYLGFKWGGFFGAIAGLILGSIADKKLYELGSVNSSFFKKKTTRQALFMQTTFAVLGHLSKSKGRVTEEDIQLANQLMNQMQLDESHRKLAQEAFSRGKATDFPLRQVIRGISHWMWTTR